MPTPSSMKALYVDSPNSPFRLAEIPTPKPGPCQVLVRIAASGVNPLDTKIRAGGAAHARHPFPAVLGIDLAGTVEEIGDGVSDFRVGDEVYGMTGGVGGNQGSLAEYAAVDARLLALTNVDLEAAIKVGRFREDLFYRLNVINIRVPPLRERREDLSQLIQHFLKQYSAKHGRDVQRVSSEALAILKAYEYPGNARELANIIERAVIVATGKKLEAQDLPGGLSAAVNAQQRRTKPQSLAQMEAIYISEILAATGGNKTESARILGISRKNLYEKIARYGL